MYEILYKRKAIKALSQINEPYYSSILEAIESLSSDPRPIGCKKLQSRSGYRIRIGSYRVIYDIFDNLLVIEIVNIGSRGQIYDD